jgi:hypothetical protein
MNTTTNPDARKPLKTSDLAAAGATLTGHAAQREEADAATRSGAMRQTPPQSAGAPESERLDALFASDVAVQYRMRWAEVQNGFVDDPRRAVAKGDELVAEVMQSLTESFANERERLEEELSHTGEASTEALRVGLRRYRSFFERLLSL